jgi:serine protease Do
MRMGFQWLDRRGRVGLAAVGLLAATGLLGTLALGGRSSAANTPAPAPNTPGKTYGQDLSQAFREAAKRVLPSVVTITNTPNVVQNEPGAQRRGSAREFDFGSDQGDSPFGGLLNDPRFKRFFQEMPEMPHRRFHGRQSQGMGSGVIIDSAGVILTNNHVIDGGGRITVRLSDGREFKAIAVKGDPKTDLAIVRIKASNLPAARLGDSDKLQVGDWVLALGQPFGLEDTVTAGIISAKGRGIGETARDNFLQTDAAINPGNSGGPLVNLEGEVVGVNTAISTSNGGFQGVGFAVPVNLARWVAQQLSEKGSVERSYLGIGIQPVNQQLANQFHLERPEGVLVTDVRSNTPASKAGLHAGDVVLEFAGKKVSTPWQLQALVEETKVGSSQSMKVLRDGKPMTLNVTMEKQPANYGETRRGEARSGEEQHEPASNDKLGLSVQDITPEIAKRLNLAEPSGVVITEVREGSPAALAGLSEGAVITQVDRKPVKSAEQFQKAINSAKLKDGVLLLVRSEQGSRFVVLRVED